MFRKILHVIFSMYYRVHTRVMLRLLWRFCLVHITYVIVCVWYDIPAMIVMYAFITVLVYDIWFHTQEVVISQKLSEQYKAKQETEEAFRPLSELASRTSRNRDPVPRGSTSIVLTEPYCVECDPEQLIELYDTSIRNENDEVVCSTCHYQSEPCYYCKNKFYRVEMLLLPNPRNLSHTYACHNCAEGLRLKVPLPTYQCQECKKDFYRDELKFAEVLVIGKDVDWGLVCKDCNKCLTGG